MSFRKITPAKHPPAKRPCAPKKGVHGGGPAKPRKRPIGR
jgi:hypothetical protein